MSANTTVHVSNIHPATTDSEIKDFFILCGKISDITVKTEGETKAAEVTFEKETAAKTALLLSNTQLGANHITVKSATGDAEDDGSHFTKNADRDTDEITQEEKPRARILAEYLAQGYVVGDAAIQRSIELDNTHGVSSRFLNTLQSLDAKYHASDRAKATDQTYGISQRANSLWSGLNSYFEAAANTPTGQKIVQFYSDGQKQVQEVHAEARRLADLKKEEHGGSAYQASGLDRVFGKEKDASEKQAPFDVAASAQQAGGSGLGTANPTPAVGTGPAPGSNVIDEKNTYA